MNKLNVQQTGGFPLETDSLGFMQAAYGFLQSLAALAGDNYILSGCVENGANVGNGVVVLSGEVIEFRGGLKQSTIVVREEIIKLPFENGLVKDVFVTRYATFGTGLESVQWNSLSRLKNLSLFKDLPNEATDAINVDDSQKLATAKAVKLLNDKINTLLPSGIIVIWSGFINQIPQGWQLYEELKDKFVLGAGQNYPVGAIGGEKEHRLTVDEMPSHDHGVSGAMRNGIQGSGFGSGANQFNNTNFRTSPAGGDQPHNNMPPYYALAYIIKL